MNMKQIIDIDLFDNDERIIINKACEGAPISTFTRSGFLTNLHFARSISTEQDVLDLLDGLTAKIDRVSEQEWEDLKLKLPFETYYGEETTVDVVPQDEAV